MVKTDVRARHREAPVVSPNTRDELSAPLALADIIIRGIQEIKGKDILLINLKSLENAVCDYFVICHGDSDRHVEAIAGFVEEITRTKRIMPWQREGFENRQWIILDYVDVVVHVFQRETRQFYDIESLWADAEVSQISECNSALL